MGKKGMEIKLATDKSVIAREKASERYLEAAVHAPQSAAKKERMPLNLAIVVDRSGSMSGEKLRAVKQAALYVVDHLEVNDRVAVIAFGSDVKIVAESTLVTDANRNRLKECIQSIQISGNTALHAGWLTGCRQVAEGITANMINRCLLLTDGLANEGETDPSTISTQAKDLYDRQVSTSTFGVGEGFNEHLLEAMSNQGGGNFYFIETAGDIAGIFEREFAELVETAVRDVEVKLEFDQAITPKVLAGWRNDLLSPGKLRIFLGSMGSNRERMVYVKLPIPAAGENATEQVVTARLVGKDKDGEIYDAEEDIRWRYVSEAEADAEQADADFMKRYAPVEIADEATEALKMERAGRRHEANERMMSSLSSRLPYISNERTEYYRDMSTRMSRGMDEGDRKRSHYEEYMFKQGRMGGETFPLERPNQHVVINDQGKKILLDTGSPISIGWVPGWTFLGKSVNLLPEFHGFNMEYLSQQVGVHLDVLQGMDVLKDYNLLLNDRAQVASFSKGGFMRTFSIRLPLTEYLMKVPAVTVPVEGQPMRLALDTGARFSFLAKNFLKGHQEVGEEHDFYPGYGEFDTPVYSISMMLDGNEYMSKCGILPAGLEMALKATGIDGLLGMDLLDKYVMQLGLRDGVLMLE